MSETGNASKKKYYPMFASLKSGAEDSREDFLQKWDNFRNLSEKFKQILISSETAEVIKEIGDKFNLSQEKIEEISRVVRNLFFGDISLENIAKEILQKIPDLGEENSQFIAETVKNKIFFATPKKETSIESIKTVKIALSQALKKYPKLGEQEITSASIKLKYFSSPVRPSINNWITDYRAALGSGSHDLMERGNYLYHSENGKKITSSDRRKLTLILRSLDENALLDIEPEKQTVVFPPDAEQETEQETGRKYNFDSMHRILGNKLQSVQNAIPRQESNQAAKAADRQLVGTLKITSAEKKPPSIERATDNVIKFEPKKPQSVSGGLKNIASVPEKYPFGRENEKESDDKKDSLIPIGSSSVGNIQFSSPQKLPVENNLNPNGNEIRSDKKEKQDPFRSYRISPIGDSFNGEEDSNDPKINGNTVDLSIYKF